MERELAERLYKMLLRILKMKKDKIPILNDDIYDVDDEYEYIRLNFGNIGNYRLIKKIVSLAERYGFDDSDVRKLKYIV